MKKVLFLLVASFGFSFADNYGSIEAINANEKTIRVNQMTIKVMPYTKIEEENCQGWEIPKQFSDLKVGQIVEIDFMGAQNNVLIAEDIEIKCANRAY